MGETMTRLYLWTVCAVALVGCHKPVMDEPHVGETWWFCDDDPFRKLYAEGTVKAISNNYVLFKETNGLEHSFSMATFKAGFHKKDLSVGITNLDALSWKTNFIDNGWIVTISNASDETRTVTFGPHAIPSTPKSILFITNVFTTNPVPPKPTEEWLREYARTNSARNAQ